MWADQKKSFVSLKQLTEICEKLTKNKINFKKISSTSIYDIPYYISNNKKVTKMYGWKPKRNIYDIAMDTYNWLLKNNYKLKVYDPQINYRPNEIDGSFEIYYNLDENLFQTQILIIANECKEFLDMNFDEIYKKNSSLIVIDPNSFLLKSKNKSVNKFKYYNIGKSV